MSKTATKLKHNATVKKKPVTKAVTRVRAKNDSIKSVSTPVRGVDGKTMGKIQLPAELFGVKVNSALLAQAVRVYLANQRRGNASTKTRGEVEGSTRKIYRQKGTGRARHGGIRAPIFVGGGIVFGPKPRDYHLALPKKMKRAAFASALSSQFKDGNLTVVDGLDKLPVKTKEMAHALLALGVVGSTLLVTPPQSETIVRMAKNIANVDILPAGQLHTYAVLSHAKLVFMRDAIPVLSQVFLKA